MSDHTNPARFSLKQLFDLPAGHGILLGLFAFVSALILAMADIATENPIAARAAEDLAASLEQVIPAGLHDAPLTDHPLIIEDAELGPVTVYRARHGSEITAVAFETSGFGYGGRIDIVLGVEPGGELLGARVLAHTETPGLGDKIEVAKSGWIDAFTGLSLTDPAPGEWKVKRDGGVFDQFSGATITPRAVVLAIRRGLEFYARHEAELLSIKETG